MYHVLHRLLGGGNAGQVGKGRHAVLLLDVFRHGKGIIAGAAACAVGDAHKGGGKALQSPRWSSLRSQKRVGLGRKNLKGKGIAS